MFNSKAIKKMKKEDSEESLETYKPMQYKEDAIPKSKTPLESIGNLKNTVIYSGKSKASKPKEDIAMMEAKMQSAKKPKVIVLKEEEKEEDEMEKKPTKFIPHGGSYLQYLKAKKK
jgi:hypothetical protein